MSREEMNELRRRLAFQFVKLGSSNPELKEELRRQITELDRALR